MIALFDIGDGFLRYLSFKLGNDPIKIVLAVTADGCVTAYGGLNRNLIKQVLCASSPGEAFAAYVLRKVGRSQIPYRKLSIEESEGILSSAVYVNCLDKDFVSAFM